MTRRVLLLGLVVAAVLAGGWFAGRQPRIQALFAPTPAKEDPLAFLKDIEVPEPVPKPERRSRREDLQPGTASPAPAPAGASATAGSFQNQVPNGELARVLMQILKAKKLAEGISISVTDTEIAVYGAVPSRDRLEQIAGILEKGREARAVNVSQVQVGP